MRHRILYVCDHAYPPALGGAEISMHLLLERLRRHGHEAETCVWRPYARRGLGELMHAANPGWVFTESRVAPHVVREAKMQGRKTAVFVYDPVEHACSHHVEDGLRVCVETGGRADPLTCPLGCLGRRIDIAVQREMFRSADLVSCSSEYTRRVIERVFGGPDADLRPVVQYPVIPGPRQHGLSRRRYVTIIRPTPGKGRRLFEQLTRRLGGHEFLAVGGQPLDVPWERVAYLPVAVRMDEVYRATRILIHPAVDAEAFGRTVAEAASLGVPSVVSSQGGLPEALGPGGIAVDDYENPDAWVRAIGQLEADYEHYARRALQHSRKFRSVAALAQALDTESTSTTRT